MTDYVPVDCARHSQYELAIMQQRRLALSWYDEHQEPSSDSVTPVDQVIRNVEEFMRVRAAVGQEHVIRLDRITACRPL